MSGKIACVRIDRTIMSEYGRNLIKSRGLYYYTADIHEIKIDRQHLTAINGINTWTNTKEIKWIDMAESLIFDTSDPEIRFGWSLVFDYPGMPRLIVLAERPRNMNITGIAYISKKYTTGSPKAISINKHHRIWGDSIFCRLDGGDLTKDDFIKYYKASKMLYDIPVNVKSPVESYMKSIDVGCAGANRQQRYKIAQTWLKKMYDAHILTYEDAWIMFAKAMAKIYVVQGYAFFEATFAHSIGEFYKIIINIKDGAKELKKNVVWSKYNNIETPIAEI